MTDIDHDRAYEIALDSELEVAPAPKRKPKNYDGPWWECTLEGCNDMRTTACKPAGCANDLIDRREFKAGVRGLHIDDNPTQGWDE